MIKKGIICETLGSTEHLQINESKDGEIRLTGVFGVCGVKNNNNRVYEKKNYGSCVTEMQHRIMTEGVLGELEHPQSNNINLNNVSHKIESIEMNEDGTITGTILLLNTAKGRDAKAIVEGGVPLFISSRAAGSIDSVGNVTLQHIQTYDLVGTPGFSQARLDLKESQLGKAVSLNESKTEGGNDMYMIVESEVSEGAMDLGGDNGDDNGDSDEKKSDEPKKSEKKEEKPTEAPTEAPTDAPTEEPKSDDAKEGEDNTENKNNDDILNNMTDIKKSIDKLTDKIGELEAQLHVAQEALNNQAEILSEQQYTVDDLTENQVNYDAIQSWITEEFGSKLDAFIKESIKESEGKLGKQIRESKSANRSVVSEIKEWCTNEFAGALQNWIVEEYSVDMQQWITEEYSKEVQNWVVEQYTPEVQNWITEEYSDNVQKWIVEQYSPEVQNWITEEYSDTVDKYINEKLDETAKNIVNECNQNVSEYLESQKVNQFDKFDRMLEQLSESQSADAAAQQALNTINEGRESYGSVYAVKNMPIQYAPMWESLSTEKRDEIVRASRMYNFSKAGVLESFWANQFSKKNHTNNLITETLAQPTTIPSRYAGIFSRAKKMQLC